jgi:DNA polymerase III subunit gamma/tau
MSYLVLARKYRPTRFREVIGQEVVTRTLQGAIEEERIGHAYLLAGPRGTGKTTTARIFAKALNCEAGPIAEPCGTCERCRAAEAGTEIDLIEIDAASNTGVDNVRELRDQAAYAPLRARFKVYLIDEVHMLSKQAFNALLKTLEEPPPHVKFLFATTEAHKLPDTILSRCQVLKLSILSEDDITSRLDEVFSREGVRAEEGVTQALARRARGGMRDALSLADQLLALVGEEPTLADIERLSSGIDQRRVVRLAERLAAFDRAGVLQELGGIDGGEAEWLEALLAHLRGCLLAAHCGEGSPLIEATPEARKLLVARARELGPDRLELFLEELLHARDSMRLLPAQAGLILELALLELARPETTIPPAEIAERLLALEGRLGEGRSVAPAASPPEVGTPPASSPPPARQAAPEPPPPSPERNRRTNPAFKGAVRSSTAEAWARVTEELAATAPALADVLKERGQLVELGGGRAVIRFKHLRQSERPLVADPRNQRLCSRVFSSILQEEVEACLEDASATPPGGEDPFTREVKDLFSGRFED